jgi:hypothetical protein
MSDHIPDPGKMVSARTPEDVLIVALDNWINPAGVAGVALSALAAAGYVIEQDWQPIETAPQDGTDVLVFDPTSPKAPKIALDWYHKEEGWLGKPTHWRPLPAPPAAAKEPQA